MKNDESTTENLWVVVALLKKSHREKRLGGKGKTWGRAAANGYTAEVSISRTTDNQPDNRREGDAGFSGGVPIALIGPTHF